jgi:hypothetical protein
MVDHAMLGEVKLEAQAWSVCARDVWWQVGTGTLAAGNRSITTADASGVIDALVATPYSFAFWDLYDITLVRLLALARSLEASI